MSEHQPDKPEETTETADMPEQHQEQKPEVAPTPATKRNYQRFEPNLIQISRALQVKKIFRPLRDDDESV